MAAIPPHLAVDPAWLTEQLIAGGCLDADNAVLAVSMQPMAFIGSTADMARARLAYRAEAPAAPATLIVKTRGRDDARVHLDAQLGLFDREAYFYRELAPRLPVRTPRTFGIGDGHTTPLVLEDLGKLRAGDQSQDLGLDDAERCVDALADLHCAAWQSTDLDDPRLMRPQSPDLARINAGLMASGVATARSIFADEFPRSALDQLPEDPDVWFSMLVRLGDGPLTLIQNDCRTDNLFFTAGGAPVFVDWQITSAARASQDLANLLAGGLAPRDLTEGAGRLLSRYHTRLSANGVTGYSFDDLFEHYRQSVVWPLGQGLFLLGMSSATDGRGVGQRIVRRALGHAVELGTFAAFTSPASTSSVLNTPRADPAAASPIGDATGAPVIDDLSCYMIAGRVRGVPDPRSQTSGRTPAQGIQDGVDAECIGFRRVFVSERWNLKECSVLLGAVGARTSRIDLGTGLFNASARNPLHAAAFGSTMHAAFGPRFVMGLGRGDRYNLELVGLRESTFAGLRDYVSIIRRLWRGESVSYDGPAGNYPQLAMGDLHYGPDPQIWFGTFGLPRAAEVIAECMDGALLVPNLSPDGTAAAVKRIRSACERVGRDPDSVRIAQCVVTAPELDELETIEICHARALTYLQTPQWGEALCEINGWSQASLAEIRAHPQLRSLDTIADNLYHRSELVAPARNIPESWMKESCAMGTIAECVAQLKAFRDAGADEIVTYGSTPGQNAALASAWRTHRDRQSHQALTAPIHEP